MRAAVQRRYGPPSVVQVEEVAEPTPNSTQLLVRVHATTVNRTDCGYRGATPPVIRLFAGLSKPRRSVLGTEYAGEITAIGSEVSRFAVGDRVFGYNEGPFGTHAEYVAVDESASVARIPGDVTVEQAAAATEGAHYALANLRRARLSTGQAILVNGATGGIGSAAVQLAKRLGATVTAVCGTDHVDLVRGLGPDRVVDYQTTDFTADEQRYDFVFDAVGKTTFSRCRHLLKPGGIFASTELGPKLQNLFLPIATRWLGPAKVIFAFPHHDQRMIERLADALEDGSFVPLIDRSYPLDEIVEAYEYVETGQKIGNVIITPPRADRRVGPIESSHE